jgi:hypothetical protein
MQKAFASFEPERKLLSLAPFLPAPYKQIKGIWSHLGKTKENETFYICTWF